jgi:hypothetical protein
MSLANCSGLATQLGYVVDDRTVGRHLHDMGWRAFSVNCGWNKRLTLCQRETLDYVYFSYNQVVTLFMGR